MAYGNGQRLGESIDPRLMQVDFSGYERAAATSGNALANMGNQIGDALKLHGEEKKQHVAAEQMAKSMAKAIPEFKPMADEFLQSMANQDLSHRDRTAMASSIQDALKLAVLGRGFANDDREFDFRERNLATEIGIKDRDRQDRITAAMNMPLPAPEVEEFGLGDGKQKLVWDGRLGRYVDPSTLVDGGNIAPPDGVQTQGDPLLTPEQLEQLTDATQEPGTGNFPAYDNGEVARNIQELEGMVLPNKPQPKQPRLGFERNRPQVMNTTLNVPAGYTTVTDHEGNTSMVPIPGSPQALESEAIKAKVANSGEQTAESARDMVGTVGKALGLIDKLDKGTMGQSKNIVSARIPGTTSNELAKDILPKIKSMATFDFIQTLKKNSPTGSTGLGATSNLEIEMLASRAGNLNVNGNPENLKDSVKEVARDFLDAVHGSKESREKALKEGGITKDANDAVELEYQKAGLSPIKTDNILTLTPEEKALLEKYATKK